LSIAIRQHPFNWSVSRGFPPIILAKRANVNLRGLRLCEPAAIACRARTIMPARQLTRDSAPIVQPRRTVAKRIALEV
jgi:hypothetical protein